ncbi:bifunctional 5,10-methylenetetrahydrofolate dehydrogenase/5,10-methenyltetrahydrofolate cyclohydrolase [Candidatus Microgenomates bacterium]|nr:bifunctional 5,10-methylenetetrahydrofolate dehydrogenase/5,10-methenyltetrahydrofolate cyclohydrolase [Candidatus Microgenomates bacterium]
MDPIIFNGREFAQNKEVGLKIKAYQVKLTKGIKPHLVSILIGDDPASKLYTSLKQKIALRIGAEMEIYEIGVRRDADHIVRLIKFLNTKEDVHGIMVQLPLPKRLKEATQEIIQAIDPKKDVDGLRDDSPYIHPTAMACIQILKETKRVFHDSKLKNLSHSDAINYDTVCVVGASGMVGRPLVKELNKLRYKVLEADAKTKNLKELTKQANIVISATGIENLIKPKMLRKQAIVIDVGSPKGDVDFEAVKNRTKFITPVPGGVGPVTITCLLENLIQSAQEG